MRQDFIYVQAQPKAQSGFVYLCGYCGEGVSRGNKLCSTCRTKKGREEILEQNLKILKDLRKKNYCLGEVALPVA